MNAVSRGPKNKKFNLWLCSCRCGWKPKFKNGNKTQNPRQKHLQEFSSKEKARLIQAVEERPVLWDLVHKEHFDAVFMKRTWEEIALVMGKDYNSCKLAWKSLRDSLKYHNKVRKQKSGSARGDLLEKPSGKECAEWEFAPYMDFLPDVSSQRRTTSSVISDEISIEDWTLDSTTISYSATEAELEAAIQDEVPEELYTYGGGKKPPPKKRKLDGDGSPAVAMCNMLGEFLQHEGNNTTLSRPILTYWNGELNSMRPEDAARRR
ncbi:uncharacterized protein LOC119557675 isoform X2 [Drosophila subpulchrella]|uniref:uncharacterized protein LOC119557675 isoform X2 n=1 Tax=Drosophila subpulchrella TaxID=1486046 RepID=UPI0018A12A1F|nr:uncharacterized protein LOC119557675 isoform X2 [Drosophila subpulchrella]